MFKNIYNKIEDYGDYILKEIKHVASSLPKREPGSIGEKEAATYFSKILKDNSADEVHVEHFKEHPKSFYGWIYITVTLVLLSTIIFFISPLISLILIILGIFFFIFEFVFYKQIVDFLFKEKEGSNVIATKKCQKNLKARIVFNGHIDAAWNWRISNRFGNIAYIFHIVIAFTGMIMFFLLSLVSAILVKSNFFLILPFNEFNYLFWIMISFIAFFSPFLIALYFMVDFNTIVDGANDNLSGCYIGVAILKALKDNNIYLDNIEIVVLLTGSEEAGLRGSKAFCKKHHNIYNDVPTFIYSFDTLHTPKWLGVNYRDLNSIRKCDKKTSDYFINAARELNIPIKKTKMPFLGGSTDASAFLENGLNATSITALSHVLEPFYHTLKDNSEHLNKKAIEDTLKISLKVLENLAHAHADK